MGIKDWRQTAAENTSIGTINWAEGQAPSTVNDSARAMMADVATQYEPSVWGWVAISATVSTSSTNIIKVAGNLTTDFVANRALKLVSDASTIYASVISSSYGSETTVTLNDLNGSLCASHSVVWLSAVEPNTLPANVVTGAEGETFGGSVSFSASVHFNAATNFKESVSFSASVQFNDALAIRPAIQDYSEIVNAIGATGGGTQDIDLELGNVVSATVDTSANTFTFSNPSASGRACSFTLFLTNGGSQTVNWPASVDWAGGSEPSLTPSGVDVLEFVTIDGGTIWYGFPSGLDMQ